VRGVDFAAEDDLSERNPCDIDPPMACARSRFPPVKLARAVYRPLSVFSMAPALPPGVTCQPNAP